MSPVISTRGGVSAGAYGWGALAGSSTAFESIATTTATGGSTVTFSSISSAYTHLQIRILAKTTADYKDFRLTANGDTGTNYSSHFLGGTGSAASAAGYATAANIRLDSGFGSGLSTFGYDAFIIDALDYASTTKYKTFRTFSGGDYNTTGGQIYVGSGLWQSTSAITSLTFTAVSGTYANPSYFALYGIKAAA